MDVGLADEPWPWTRVLSRRLFPGRQQVPTPWRELYRRSWTSPMLASNTRHRLAYAD